MAVEKHLCWQPECECCAEAGDLLRRIAELEAALAWYGEQAKLCRLIHSGGDAGRHALSEDGGVRARAVLETQK